MITHKSYELIKLITMIIEINELNSIGALFFQYRDNPVGHQYCFTATMAVEEEEEEVSLRLAVDCVCYFA